MNIILAIDDMPRRYDDFPLPPDTILVTTCRLEDYKYYVRQHWLLRLKIVGVLLDHDMPFQSGQYFARLIREDLHVPVCLTSVNMPGRAAMHEILHEYEIPVIHCDCTWPDWRSTALDFITSN